MIHVLQKMLTFSLILLQFIAPLVHAHAQRAEPQQGIHVPGLEFVSKSQSSPAALLQVSKPLHLSEGCLIGVSSGIKQNLFMPLPADDAHNVSNIVYRIDDPNAFSVGFSPHLTALLSSQHIACIHASRAPPA